MRSLTVALALILVSGCTIRIALHEGRDPVVSRYSLALSSRDTTLTGTLTMLSDKLQVLDVTRIDRDTAFRVARLLMDSVIEPYYGGAINVHVRPGGKEAWGYAQKVELLEYREIPVARETVRKEVGRLLERQGKRLNQLIREKGLGGWKSDGVLNLEGYDSNKRVAIFSMAGRVNSEGNIEYEPLLVVWASPEGKILKAWLTILTRRLERS
jgi:hypothetical protein